MNILNDWDHSADLVVVGYGGAGAAAAIEAADAGSTVIIIEKQNQGHHNPSTRQSGGMVTVVHDGDRAAPYFDHCAGGMIPTEVSRAWAIAASGLLEWLTETVGIEMIRTSGAEHPEWEGADAVSAYGPAESYPTGDAYAATFASMSREERVAWARRPPGNPLFEALERAVVARSTVSVQYGSRAQRLITDSRDRVIGVEVEQDGRIVKVRALHGVVLTCGGYGYDEEMKLSYLRASPTYFYGSPANTGDGVRMAQALGADLWHMNSMIGRAIGHVEDEGISHNFLVNVVPGGYVLVDRYGRRFANEHLQATSRHDFYYELLAYDVEKAEHPRIPCYWLFDSRRMESAPLSGGSGEGDSGYQWSPDNLAELRRGWFSIGSTWKEVAERAGISDPEQLEHTINDYNMACLSGEDRFGRPATSLTPLDNPPYYCMPLWPGGPNTSGGPRRNEHAEVLDVFGKTIAGLYEAGELGEVVGALYPANGGNLSDALCFGRIAARRALAGQPGADD